MVILLTRLVRGIPHLTFPILTFFWRLSTFLDTGSGKKRMLIDDVWLSDKFENREIFFAPIISDANIAEMKWYQLVMEWEAFFIRHGSAWKCFCCGTGDLLKGKDWVTYGFKEGDILIVISLGEPLDISNSFLCLSFVEWCLVWFFQ